MKLFRKRDKSSLPPAAWLIRLRSGIEQRQRKAANYLSHKTQYWNRSSWIVALIIFILLFGGSCLLLCIKAFIHF